VGGDYWTVIGLAVDSYSMSHPRSSFCPILFCANRTLKFHNPRPAVEQGFSPTPLVTLIVVIGSPMHGNTGLSPITVACMGDPRHALAGPPISTRRAIVRTHF